MTGDSSNSIFRFRHFSVKNEKSALKVGTDAVLLGAAVTVRDSDRYLLDIGTGTGVIALMVAQRISAFGSGYRIEAIDIDPLSSAEAGENFASSPWSANLTSRNIALQEYRPKEKFDLIFSNPPYYDESLKNPDVRESIARHTESLSYRQICAFASEYLGEDGRLSLILPSEAETSLRRTAASFGLYPFRVLRIRTTAAKSARRIVAEFSRRKTEVPDEEIVLQDSQGRTPEYSALTADFYL